LAIREIELLRGDALANLGKAREALAAYEAGLEAEDLGPEGSVGEAFFRRAILRAQGNDAHGALADYTRSLEIQPDAPRSALARGRRGWAYLIRAARLAYEDFDAAIRLAPGDPDLYNGRGYARVQLGEYRQGVADVEQALELSAAEKDPDLRLGILVNAAGTFAQASGRAALDLAADDHADLADRYEARAVELVREALALQDPDLMRQHLEQIAADPAFDPIRHRPAFRQLSDQ
jgi:tetratricopeptide (TPR) repeat protein